MGKKFRLIGIVLTAAFAAAGCEPDGPRAEAGASAQPSPVRAAEAAPSPKAPPAGPVTFRAKLSAVGDILIHNTVYQDAYGAEGGYDFRPMFAPVKELLQKPDLLIANQESLIGGKELGLSSYPMFNSPAEVGEALRDAGVDLVTTANNHTMDKGEKGVLAAAGHWDRIGLPYTGAFRSEADRDKLRVLEAGGIRVAFLAYTYGTNGMPVPADKPYLVNRFDPERMEREIKRAKAEADVAVVSMHWGTEYQEKPGKEQREWARRLADWGADVIVGTHPHVLQPMEWLDRADGSRTLVMYSLGNFLSAQDQLSQLIGGVGQVELVKKTEGGRSEIRLQEPAFFPTYTKYKNWRTYRVIPFPSLEQEDRRIVAAEWERIKKRLLAAMPELRIAE